MCQQRRYLPAFFLASLCQCDADDELAVRPRSLPADSMLPFTSPADL
jgi:hypothetical protein